MKEADRIGSYILERRLGRGISASTWLAASADEVSGERRAVLKILDLSEAPSWSAVDIFRREAEALRRLSHPGIPAYLENFEAEEGGRLRLVLAMEYVEGRDLEKIVSSGGKFTEAEIAGILARLADILAYLGALRPPIVHRDVNPRNVLLKSDGSIALVDFSGVQDAMRAALFPGATLVGTAGYIPPEQVAGRASHRSDLYGAAATAVFLLTGRNPAELPASGLALDLNCVGDLSPGLRAVLASWLEPDAAARTISAEEAALILRGRRPPPRPEGPRGALSRPGADAAAALPAESGLEPRAAAPESLPADSRVAIERGGDSLRVRLPRARLGGGQAGPGALFAAVWIGFVAFWTFMAVAMGAPLVFPLFSIPFWGVGFYMAKATLAPLVTKRELLLTRKGLSLSARAFGFERSASWPLADVGAARLGPSRVQVNSRSSGELLIEAGTRQLRFGAGLSERELRYLERLLNDERARLAHPAGPSRLAGPAGSARPGGPGRTANPGRPARPEPPRA